MTARRSTAILAALLLCAIACDRTHLSTRTHAFDLGEVAIQQWDDPVDTLISWRVYWQGEGRREPVAEIWRGPPWMSHDDPVRLARDADGVLRLRIGPFHCFERIAPDTPCATYDIAVEDWRHCSASRRKTC